jgi:hypothetical protein
MFSDDMLTVFVHYMYLRYPALSKSGVRFVYKGDRNTLAQDLEPEQITLSADEKKAFVSLQVRSLSVRRCDASFA